MAHWLTPKRVILMLYLLGLIVLLVFWRSFGLEPLRVWLVQAGPSAYVAFIGAYVVCSVFFLPVLWLNVLAGLLFGPFLGALWIMAGVTLGASASFYLSRYVFHPQWLQERLMNPGTGLTRLLAPPHAWRSVLFLRLSNAVPFAVLNYVSGQLNIPYSRYILATMLGSLPGTLICSGLGALVYTWFAKAA